ncbi:unnamed protein product [Phytomonas sp. Hart1]|nr:unnamed protein product [Phytomonas sp. Hart1]|eukprot:CCW71579.1 unnamed protein product [Phytomonas sp. isolate Hart1]
MLDDVVRPGRGGGAVRGVEGQIPPVLRRVPRHPERGKARGGQGRRRAGVGVRPAIPEVLKGEHHVGQQPGRHGAGVVHPVPGQILRQAAVLREVHDQKHTIPVLGDAEDGQKAGVRELAAEQELVPQGLQDRRPAQLRLKNALDGHDAKRRGGGRGGRGEGPRERVLRRAPQPPRRRRERLAVHQRRARVRKGRDVHRERRRPARGGSEAEQIARVARVVGLRQRRRPEAAAGGSDTTGQTPPPGKSGGNGGAPTDAGREAAWSSSSSARSAAGSTKWCS